MPKALFNTKSMLEAFGTTASVVPARSPKPILQSVKLVADADEGSILMATDLEVGIRHRVLGMKVEQPGAVILPTSRFGSILRTSADEELSLDADGYKLTVTGLHAKFNLPAEDPALFPDVPPFTFDRFHVVSAGDLRKAIKRTIFATDESSSRYALGGCLVELTPESLAMVGTDGRRLARMQVPAEAENGAEIPPGSPVIPVKALKLIERNLGDADQPVHIAWQVNGNVPASVMVRTERAVIFSRLCEGRFPRYQDVFPAAANATADVCVMGLLHAVRQVQITTSEESRGADFAFGDGVVRLSSQSADVGSSAIELGLTYSGDPLTITFDPQYLAELLSALAGDEEQTVRLELVDAKNPLVMRAGDGYVSILMPLTRER